MRAAARIRSFAALLTFALGCLVSASTLAQPLLRYTPPKAGDFYRSAFAPPDDFNSTTFMGTLQVYPMQPADASIEAAFRATLLRDWIKDRYRETELAGPPQFAPLTIPGARGAVMAMFADRWGAQRLRILIMAEGAAALVDVTMTDRQAVQGMEPVVQALVASLRVETPAAKPAPPPLSASAARGVAGIYLGMAPKTMVDPTRPLWGNFYTRMSAHYILLSADGRMYHTFNKPEVNDVARFDFAAAERADPGNAGRYSIDGRKLVIEIIGGLRETFTTEVPSGGRLLFNGAAYERQ